jgi:RNA polymerase sigma factor, sigma-70 family
MDETIARAVGGDAAAIGALYQQYTPQLRRYLVGRCGSADTDDLISEVWLRVLRRLPAYEERGYPFSAWLYRVAECRCIDMARQQQRRPSVPIAERHWVIGGPEVQIDAWDAHAAVGALMPRLLPRQRTVIALRFLHDWSLEETAAALGIGVNVVKSLQHRAIARLGRECRGL